MKNPLSFLFKKKEEVVVKSKEPLPSEQLELKYGSVLCEYCGDEICCHDQRKKLYGKSYHIKCSRKAKKQAKEMFYKSGYKSN